jgi:hypothetical protein
VSDRQTMSLDEFEQNEATILADICALLKDKAACEQSRTQAIYERSTGARVAEVLLTTKGPVVVHRVAAIYGSDFQPQRIDIRGFRREHGIAPLTGDPNQQFAIKGKAAVYVVLGQHFLSGVYPQRKLTDVGSQAMPTPKLSAGGPRRAPGRRRMVRPGIWSPRRRHRGASAGLGG